MKLKNTVGKVILNVSLSSDKEYFTLMFQDGTKATFSVEGGCCSSSWIEHLTVPDPIAGATILSAKDGGGVAWDNHECSKSECSHDCLQVYNTTFNTDKGNIILEYRNDSNGYYGGSLVECN
jgi:hypothetical protein